MYYLCSVIKNTEDMKKVTIALSESDLVFLTTALEARIYEYKFGNVSVSKDVAGMIVDSIQSLLDRINFEHKKSIDNGY